ncbi:agmatine deiminase family protein [Barnesiella viscericola]|uniref:Agmatine deiminase family protein n=1 Tax=Barnesiella viscericola TaxID=397865 RepID=A0A921MRF2_9BACT|nr:agmatine deiminase family protein [Barnesiella viscericola]HJG88817.1 agmatine deiminase family protein [Barnesiella viscericola]
MTLQQKLQKFSLSQESRNNILHGSAAAPKEFEQIAQIVLSGYFLVQGASRDVIVRPTCVEFYYHEEWDNGIKDLIVYHRNSKDSPKPIFPLGVLHNHVSGIDITFERGADIDNAVRASMLIREFEKDEENEERSTLLYEMLYQQRSIFDGISVKWVDGERMADVTSYPRKNVALYEEDGRKMVAEKYPDSPRTEDKKYVQDPRHWQFRRKIVSDADTNMVYISSWLEDECPHFYPRFLEVLKENDIPFKIMKRTNDIWARDYMPIQIYDNRFVQYHYNPDYLQKKKEDRESITDVDAVCREIELECVKTDLIVDGGNVVKVGKYIIMTEKVYAENKHLTPAKVRNQLQRLFHCQLIMLPWDKDEKYGHADGIVKAIDDHSVLLTNYADYNPQIAERFSKILSQYFDVKTLNYTVKSNDYNWAYINFLRVGDVIILPGLNIPEDQQALQQIKRYYPSCKVVQIDSLEVVKKDGALNCITWNIKK